MTAVIRKPRQRGQALVEFSLAFLVFATMLFGIIDFGRGIYAFNGVSQAAREIARVTSVHPGTVNASSQFPKAGWSTQMNDIIAVQKTLVPGLADPTITCVDTSGVLHTPCNFATDSVKVVVSTPFGAVTPIISSFGSWTMTGSATYQIQ